MSRPHLDVPQLARGLNQLAAAIRATANPTAVGPVFHGDVDGAPTCALVLKRTYRVENGACVLAPPEKQSPLCFDDVPYAPVELPEVAPCITAGEDLVLRRATDVVVQGFGCAYDARTTRTTAVVRFGDVERSIVVHGDRVAERAPGGRIAFSEARPFRLVPLRWDRAYGGFDYVGFERYGERLRERLDDLPVEALELTPFHYPRNPCGRGFMRELDEDFLGRPIPNLEHPFDPIRPDRLATGTEAGWIRAPLPAAWDFTDPAWFPRSAYLGLGAWHDRKVVPREVERGWAPKDLTSIRSVLHARGTADVRTEWMQAGAPGMAFPALPVDATFVFENLHPLKPVHTVRLPADVPHASLDLGGPSFTDLAPRMSAVVHRVPLNEVEIQWSCRAPLPERFDPERLASAAQRVVWQRPAERS